MFVKETDASPSHERTAWLKLTSGLASVEETLRTWRARKPMNAQHLVGGENPGLRPFAIAQDDQVRARGRIAPVAPVSFCFWVLRHETCD